MSKYILELKNRFILLLLTWLFVIIVSYIYRETLLFLFLESEFFVNKEFKVYYFIFTDIVEVFNVYLNLIVFFSSSIYDSRSLNSVYNSSTNKFIVLFLSCKSLKRGSKSSNLFTPVSFFTYSKASLISFSLYKLS